MSTSRTDQAYDGEVGLRLSCEALDGFGPISIQAMGSGAVATRMNGPQCPVPRFKADISHAFRTMCFRLADLDFPDVVSRLAKLAARSGGKVVGRDLETGRYLIEWDSVTGGTYRAKLAARRHIRDTELTLDLLVRVCAEADDEVYRNAVRPLLARLVVV